MIKTDITNLKKDKSSFTLIELSVVLAIIAIIVLGSITVGGNAIKNAKINTTKERLELIKTAINNFVFNNRRLPCPASLTLTPSNSNYGKENGIAGTCANLSSNSNADDLAYGAIPIVDLGLDKELLGDGFDNKFSYIVSAPLTRIYDKSETTDPNLGFEGSNISSAVDAINVQENISGSDITLQAVYVVLSHGANGYGAYGVDSSTQNSSGTANEILNSYASDFTNVFIVESIDKDFDDILIYDTRKSIMYKTGVFDTTVCLEEDSTYVPNCASSGSLTFPATYYNLESNSNESCASLTGCTSGTATRKCGLNGQWGLLSSDCG